VPLDVYLGEVLNREAQTEESAEVARRAAVKRGRGMFAHCGETPEERRRAKDEELRREAAL
jgi:cytosine/adenosine deaminase-related metal-dependent hydrolase